MLELNPGLIVWTIITFLAVLLILSKTAWKPLVGALTKREEEIRTSIAQAEGANAEAQRLLEENKRQLAMAEAQSQAVVREGRQMGERLKAEIVDKANAGARQMIEQAKEEIRREKDAALLALRAEVADLAVTAAGKIIDETLDVNKHRALVDTVIKDLPAGEAGIRPS